MSQLNVQINNLLAEHQAEQRQTERKSTRKPTRALTAEGPIAQLFARQADKTRITAYPTITISDSDEEYRLPVKRPRRQKKERGLNRTATNITRGRRRANGSDNDANESESDNNEQADPFLNAGSPSLLCAQLTILSRPFEVSPDMGKEEWSRPTA
jgi:hypothetical protein